MEFFHWSTMTSISLSLSLFELSLSLSPFLLLLLLHLLFLFYFYLFLVHIGAALPGGEHTSDGRAFFSASHHEIHIFDSSVLHDVAYNCCLPTFA